MRPADSNQRPWLRRPTLYPAELRAHRVVNPSANASRNVVRPEGFEPPPTGSKPGALSRELRATLRFTTFAALPAFVSASTGSLIPALIAGAQSIEQCPRTPTDAGWAPLLRSAFLAKHKSSTTRP